MKLERTTFSISRAADYFRAKELEKMMGQPRDKFAAVVLKELVDNALDACETVGVAPEVRVKTRVEGAYTTLTVSDSAGGIPPDAVRRIIDYNTKTSDKSAYRSPTRGAQGNALKTVIGIPHALGSREPVVVEARGVRHEIKPRVLPGGDVRMDHDETAVPSGIGTSVTVTLPTEGRELDVDYWGRAFALVNPHASVMWQKGDERDVWRWSKSAQIYKLGGDFRKIVPTDPIPAHWYDVESLAQLIGAHNARARDGAKDLPLGEFIRNNFRGLASTKKAKDVARYLPGISHLLDFEEQPGAVPVLLSAMQGLSTPPTHNVLGAVGREHFEQCFEEWYGVERFWYKHVKGEMYGLPYRFEAAAAETRWPGELFTTVNYSPTFDDPFAKVALQVGGEVVHGLEDYLVAAHASPKVFRTSPGITARDEPNTAAVVHLVTPAPRYLDLGKSGIHLPFAAQMDVERALWHVVKDLHKEGKRRRRNASSALKRERKATRTDDMDLNEAVFKVLPAAVEHTTGGGRLPVGVRRLFYAVRDLIKDHTPKRLDSGSAYNYFSQTLVPSYQEEHGVIEGLYYDPRGRLYEPHTGESVDLGTREVAAYEFPEHVFDKILFVEKRGQKPLLDAAKIAERYDMAIITGEGFATTAAKRLLENASKDKDYQLFVLHDADPSGYNIARTVREETRRMPGYKVEVIDLGLTVDQALRMGLEPEEFVRQDQLPAGVLEELEEGTPAHEFFTGEETTVQRDGKPKTVWRCKRVELDKMTAPQAIRHLEDELERAGVRPKVIPPEDALPELAEDLYREEHARWVEEALHELASLPEIQQVLADRFKGRFDLEKARAYIEGEFEKDASLSWRAALKEKLNAVQVEHAAALKEAVRQRVKEALESPPR